MFNLPLGLAGKPFRNSQPADEWVFPYYYSRRLRGSVRGVVCVLPSFSWLRK